MDKTVDLKEEEIDVYKNRFRDSGFKVKLGG